MLKKIMLTALAAISLAACNDDGGCDAPTVCPTDGTKVYSGTLEVTPQEGSPFTAFSEEEIIFELKQDEQERYLLWMPKIKFVKEMPVYVSFEVRGIDPAFDGQGGFRFSLDETTPYRNGAPYDPDGTGTYTIRSLEGSSADGTILDISFDCHSMHVVYRGSRQQA